MNTTLKGCSAPSRMASKLNSTSSALRTIPAVHSNTSVSSRVVSWAPSCPYVTSRARNVVRMAGAGNGATATAKPTPIVKIDNMTDPFATVVTVEYGDAQLLDTVTALKNLNLNIRRAKLAAGGAANTFFITDSHTSEKIVKSARLEEIRMTVLNSLAQTFPESAAAMGGAKPSESEAKPLGQRKVVPTTIEVKEAPNGAASILKIVTGDRPGLLVDIVRVLKDINLNVVSAEVDTVGAEARDEFFVTYHGEPLSSPMVLLVSNSLQYYLSLNEVAKEESY